MTAERTAPRTGEAHGRRRAPLAAAVFGSAALAAAALVAPAAVASSSSLALPTSAAVVAPATGTTLLSVTDPAALGSAAAAVRAGGGTVLATYDVAGALLVSLPAGAVAPAGTVVVPDTGFTFASAGTTDAAALPASTYRATIGDDDRAQGAGVTVALVDTGVAEVGDLAGRVEHVNVSGDVTGDGYGHGTFLAGLVAGDGTSSGGAYAGVAPQARILDVQVATADGSTSMARVLAGLQAVADRAGTDPSLRVLALALSTGSPLPPSVDPLGRALDTLWRRGVTVVVAAGNDGPDNATVSAPGDDPLLLTVGSVDEATTADRGDDTVADFSSRGTRFGVAKPELVVPGVSLISLGAPGSLAVTENPQSVVAGDYLKGTGTSMSTAVAAGAVASLMSARSGLTPATVKGVLTATAYDVPGAGAGAGGLDLAAATTAPLRTTSGSPSPGHGNFAPDEADAAAWAAFAAAWEAGDLEGVRAAWALLSPQSRRWSATAWSVAVVAASAGLDEQTFDSRRWSSRRWSLEAWDSRRWSTDEWVSRRWSGDDWASRRWSFADWASRRWSADDWTSRRWSDEDWASRRWSTADWDSRRWSEEDWLAFAWTSRRWSSSTWASDAWDSRRWSSRRWSAADWSAFTFESRRWSTQTWDSRRWSVQAW